MPYDVLADRLLLLARLPFATLPLPHAPSPLRRPAPTSELTGLDRAERETKQFASATQGTQSLMLLRERSVTAAPHRRSRSWRPCAGKPRVGPRSWVAWPRAVRVSSQIAAPVNRMLINAWTLEPFTCNICTTFDQAKLLCLSTT